MFGTDSIHSYRNRINKLNIIYSIIPKQYINTDDNKSLEKSGDKQLYSHRYYKPKIKTIQYQNINVAKTPTNNSITHTNRSDTHNNNYFMRTYEFNHKYSLSNKKSKNIFKLKENNTSKLNNKSEKISLKLIVNEFCKPDEKIRIKNKVNMMRSSIIRKKNYSTQYTKTTSSNNNLSYYYPKLFNVPYNRLLPPDNNINTSTFFFKNLKALNYDEEIKSFTVKKNNNNKKKIDKIIDNKKKPIFIEKIYNFDILKNLRFTFKNPIEKGKLKNFINDFYITKNLEFNND
jgi:hypothetical protein